jgi:peptide/nickel transport system permease protein
VVVTLITTVVGTLVGISAAYFDGWYDAVVSRLLDFVFGFPQLVFMIALGIIVPGGLLPAPVCAVPEHADRRRGK